MGDVNAKDAGTHGFRRGYACDLALCGAKLKEILEAGDWRSAAFRAYLESIKDELASKAMMRLLGSCSDSEEEEGE